MNESVTRLQIRGRATCRRARTAVLLASAPVATAPPPASLLLAHARRRVRR